MTIIKEECTGESRYKKTLHPITETLSKVELVHQQKWIVLHRVPGFSITKPTPPPEGCFEYMSKSGGINWARRTEEWRDVPVVEEV